MRKNVVMLTILLLMSISSIESKTITASEFLIDEDFAIDPESYIFFNVNLDSSKKYRLSMAIDESCQMFMVDNKNFQLFQEKETFYTISNSKVQFWFDTPFFFEYGDGLSIPYETNYTGEAVFILNNIQDVMVSGHLTFEITSRDFTTETTFLIIVVVVTLLSLGMVGIFIVVKQRRKLYI